MQLHYATSYTSLDWLELLSLLKDFGIASHKVALNVVKCVANALTRQRADHIVIEGALMAQFSSGKIYAGAI